MTLLIVIGFATYTFFLFGYDTSNVITGKNFGTISTSLGSPFLDSSDAPLTLINLEIINVLNAKNGLKKPAHMIF